MRIKYVRGVSRELEQEVSDEVGLSLIQSGMAVQVFEKKAEGLKETAAGVDVDQFIAAVQAETGIWIRASEVAEGDEFEVTGFGEIDDETFDRSYLVLPVRYKNEERKLRLGVRNAERIKKKLGSDTAGWVKKCIKVTAVELVPGLTKQRGVSTKRMILDGVA